MAKAANLDVTVRTALAEVVELIPRKVRTALYVAAVAVALLAFASQRVVAVWWPQLDVRVDATVADVVTACLFLIGLLGTAYRPTLTDHLQPADAGYEALYAQEAQARTIQTLTAAGYDHAAAVDAVQAGDLSRLTRRDPDGV
jgi:uncharacterized membrane protein